LTGAARVTLLKAFAKAAGVGRLAVGLGQIKLAAAAAEASGAHPFVEALTVKVCVCGSE
jgi:hypothetical protein